MACSEVKFWQWVCDGCREAKVTSGDSKAFSRPKGWALETMEDCGLAGYTKYVDLCGACLDRSAEKKKSNKHFSQLATEFGLTPETTTALTIIARHPHGDNEAIKDLKDHLKGESKKIAEVLLGQDSDNKEINRMAEIFHIWATRHNK